MFKEKDKIKIVAAGAFQDRNGTVEAIAEDVPKCIGIKLEGSGSQYTVGALVWCKPDEIQLRRD